MIKSLKKYMNCFISDIDANTNDLWFYVGFDVKKSPL